MAAHNHFIPQKPACDLEAFWGRQRELRLLSSYLLDSEQPQSCAVVGPVSIGKTSLLCHLRKRHEAALARHITLSAAHMERLQRTVEISLPMSDLTSARVDRFYQRLLGEMRRRLAALAAQGQPALSLPSRTEVADPTAPLERFRELLDNACAAGYRFHFVLDDFAAVTQNLGAFDETFFTQLRSCAQHYTVAWVIASDYPLLGLWSDGDVTNSPFFSSLRPMSLGLLSDDDADALLEETARRGGRTFTPEERTALRQLAGPHPAFLQLAGWHLYEARFARRLAPRAALADATHRYMAAAQARYAVLWEQLAFAERQALLALLPAEVRQPSAQAAPNEDQAVHLKALAQQCVLRVDEASNGYRLFGEGFVNFLRDLPPDAERSDEEEYDALSRLVMQREITRDEREHIKTALGLFREGKYEAGLRDLFPSLEQIAGALIQQHTRRTPEQQFGPRLEQLRHLGVISQESFDLGFRLVPERINATHGYPIADARHVARSTVILGRRLLEESQRGG
jgi:hypothetical protein